jgi:type IV pilus assembly protein PilY1
MTTTILVRNAAGAAGNVSSITVNGVEILNGSVAIANVTSSDNIAEAIKNSINALTDSFSATRSGSAVTVTGPASAANHALAVTHNIPTTKIGVNVFPDTTASKLTNFANWHSYYRTRMLMMKTATGLAFNKLDKNYRIGLTKTSLSDSTDTPAVGLDTFWNNTDTSLGPTSTHRTTWYNTLYATTVDGSTPLRDSLSNAGRYYAGKLSGTDPVQYSCQQNFTMLSTDGYWNVSTANGYQVDGSTDVGNQDSAAERPYFDGYVAPANYTYTYTRNTYSKVTDTCTSGRKKLLTQPQIGSCTAANATAGCNPTDWPSNGAATLGTSCNNTAAPGPSAKVLQGTPVLSGHPGSTDSLADVAMYYYKTDLRNHADFANCGTAVPPATVGPLCEDNVFKTATDELRTQHMTTFTLGLGASGWMNYVPGYTTAGFSADYDAVKLGSTSSATVCTWQPSSGEVCNWPTPGMSGSDGLISNIDDLWHAAVNGRGNYFSATNPETLAAGLSGSLAKINARRGAAAAAATSTLNPVAGNNYAFVASYTTVDWKGNLEARGINTDTGVVSESASWCVEDIPVAGACVDGSIVAQTTGDTTISNCETPVVDSCSEGVIECSGNTASCTTAQKVCKVQVATSCVGTLSTSKTSPMVSASSDTRTIYTANTLDLPTASTAAGTTLINFDATYAAANPTHFDATKLAGLSQWTDLDATQRTNAVGANLVKFLRGQYAYEDRSANEGPPDNRLYRFRGAVLGDALESQPSFIGKPVFSYPYPGYAEYKTAQAARAGTVYMGTNDGMIHAFNSATGVERWAYVPSMVIPNMWKLADKSYASLHSNFVNGSPITSDICSANCNNAAFASTPSTADDPVWKTILVAGLNGGGRGYYALDITNPASPSLLWEFTTTAGIGVTKDDDLGFSYGQPVITKKSDGTWVVLVTSGYNNVSPGDGEGHLFVLNANTGAMLHKVDTGEGDTTTPSGLAKIAGFNNEPPGNAVGYVYGGDLSGNVWRFDVNNCATGTAPTSCDVIKFATLLAGTTPQPIMTTPVLGKISGSRVVFIGTGKYLETGDVSTTTQQTQYAIKDDNSGATFVNPRSQTTLMVQQTITTDTAAGTRSVGTTASVDFGTKRGWFVDLPDTGERINIDSQLVQGVLLVPSIVPSNTACSPGGYGWLNFFDYKTGGAVTASDLVSTKYDSTIVGVNVFYIDGEPVVGVVTSTDPTPKKDDDVTFPAVAGDFTGKRTLWRELMQ